MDKRAKQTTTICLESIGTSYKEFHRKKINEEENLRKRRHIGENQELRAKLKMAWEERSPLRLSLFPNVPPFIRVLPPGIQYNPPLPQVLKNS